MEKEMKNKKKRIKNKKNQKCQKDTLEDQNQ